MDNIDIRFAILKSVKIRVRDKRKAVDDPWTLSRVYLKFSAHMAVLNLGPKRV